MEKHENEMRELISKNYSHTNEVEENSDYQESSDFSEEEDDELDPFYISNRDIEDPYHEQEYSEDDQKNYMGRNKYRVKREHRENGIIFEQVEEQQ